MQDPTPGHVVPSSLGRRTKRATIALYPGDVVNSLTLLQRDGSHWRCKCVCGKLRRVRAAHITSGHTKSCGCHALRVFQRVATAIGREMPPDPRIPAR